MVVLDFGPIYTDTGNIVQHEYARKCTSNGRTILAIKYSSGILIATENPIDSILYKPAESIKKSASKHINVLHWHRN
ncbi:hypothetical protein EDEG_00887 [Edhazardia aedis USNM 41457]|uniref:Proteasome alpha-type subunits domain-containing protein n=1 Tax=Edhazardia aedis (strain USNM 41457) TaxID=1003232 RepID=J9DUN4_EDHAE|nr:hypothetical protein EDEG_00887 [Edhazardia aedis USNM 41457]|eukprot:EJW05007.1 hypothetical protein EDEG_00887 [Edhazardia aedis USNM 41457]